MHIVLLPLPVRPLFLKGEMKLSRVSKFQKKLYGKPKGGR